MKKILLFTLFFVSISYSQEVLSLYEQQIPSKIKTVANLRKLANQKLDFYGKLNPDLIYFYLNFLDRFYNQSMNDNEKNSFHYLDALEKRALLMRKKWAEQEVAAIGRLTLNTRLGNQAKKYYRNFFSANFQEKIVECPYNPDQNKIYYFKKIYYSLKKNPGYDAKSDYGKICRELEKEKLGDYISYSSSGNSTDSPVSRKIVDKSLDEWYLFDNNEANSETKLQHHKLILTYLQDNYAQFRKHKLTLKIGNVFINQNLNHSDILKHVNQGLEVYSGMGDFRRNQISVGLQYKYFLRDYFDLFSYVKFEIGWAGSPGKTNMEQGVGFSNTEVYYSQDYYDKTTYHYNIDEVKISDIQLQSYYSKVTAPIFFISNNLSFDCGVLLQWNRISYFTDYREKVGILSEITQLGVTKWQEGYELQHDKSDYSEFAISPGLDISYVMKLKYLIQVQSYFNGNLFLALKFGYSL